MKILFNGCSQTEVGNLDYLENWQEHTWPHLLAESFECEYKNLAITLSDNSRIFSTTLNEILAEKPDIIIVGWTSSDRKQLPLANGDMVRLNQDCAISDNATDITDLQPHKYWYTHHQNDWLSYIESLEYKATLKIICDQFEIQLYNFNAVNTDIGDYLIKSSFNTSMKRKPFRSILEKTKASNLLDILDQMNWLLPQSQSLLSYCKSQKLSMDKWGHPELGAQQQIADYFRRQINV